MMNGEDVIEPKLSCILQIISIEEKAPRSAK